ncbi:MAG: TIGR03960 family B12-binding radical SAM protein [Planctomycetes bacterium]|nr:TIGR03960 family B12-binding radical SAM protein [Planctomycetota bacterium]
MSAFDDFLARALPSVRTPVRYVGGERNVVRKDPSSVAVRFALVFPDVYEIGMSHLGLKILYDVLNRRDDCYAERAFAPWIDMEERMRAGGVPLWSLETRTPLSAFDIVGFSLQYESSFTTTLLCLDLGGIPLRTADRTLEHPLVVAGGAVSLNPEPMADFVDLFFLGDGEEAVERFVDAYREVRPRARDRRELLLGLVEALPFLYAPSLWAFEWNGDGTLAGAKPTDASVRRPERAIVRDFQNAPYPAAPVVPYGQTVHDRITIEIMRGCVQGCRFCQAGYEKRPQRFRDAAKVLEIAKETYRNTGYDEIALTSLSSSDHPGLLGMMDALDAEFADRRVGVSLPSLRVNEQVLELPKRIRSVRKSGLTLAPEVASDRLRKIINKTITNEDLYRGVEEAWRQGWQTLKLYFMVGLPEEQEADIAEIVTMAETCSELRRKAGKGPGKVNAAISTFVPKPLTPFQWHGQSTIPEVELRQGFLRSLRRLRSVNLKFHDPRQSQLEGILTRADRRVGPAIERAYRLGARLDAWDDCFRYEAWLQAFEEKGVDVAWYANRERPLEEVFPWDHLGNGVDRAYLQEELQKSQAGEETEHCQTGACGDCGVGAKSCVEIKGEAGYWEKFNRIVAKFKERKAAEALAAKA